MTHQTSEAKSPHDMTVHELQAEIGRLQRILHFRVLGDPRVGVSALEPRGHIPEVDLTSDAWRRAVEADKARRAAAEAGK